MIRKITNDNLYLLLPGKISQLARIYAESKGISLLDAIRFIYHSNTYKELEREESKLWHYGPIALYEILEEKH